MNPSKDPQPRDPSVRSASTASRPETQTLFISDPCMKSFLFSPVIHFGGLGKASNLPLEFNAQTAVGAPCRMSLSRKVKGFSFLARHRADHGDCAESRSHLLIISPFPPHLKRLRRRLTQDLSRQLLAIRDPLGERKCV